MQDQVARLQAWRASHPDIEIRAPDYPHGSYYWTDHRDGHVLARERELKALLDRLAQEPA